jgi:IS30 family transposase
MNKVSTTKISTDLNISKTTIQKRFKENYKKRGKFREIEKYS